MTIMQERTDLSDVESDDAPTWRVHSRCIVQGGGSTLKAKKICGVCPVRQQGLELGLDQDECFGSLVLAEMIADLEPGDEVTVFNREVVGDDAASATEQRGVTLHSVMEPHQPTRIFGYVRTANGSADPRIRSVPPSRKQWARSGSSRTRASQEPPQALTAPGCASCWWNCRPATKSSSGSTTDSDGPSRQCGPSLS